MSVPSRARSGTSSGTSRLCAAGVRSNRRRASPRRRSSTARAANHPHLHTHLVVANLAPDAGGRWSALDARALFANVGVAGALYRAELRYEISRRLAVSWQARAEGFADLIGIPAAAVRGFSRRSAEISAELARTGWSGPHSARLVADRTRPDKVLTRDYPALVAGWREQAFALGVSRASVGRLGTAAPQTAPAGIGRDPRLASPRRRVGRVPRPRLRPA